MAACRCASPVSYLWTCTVSATLDLALVQELHRIIHILAFLSFFAGGYQ
jgi:hypothetical protein